MAWSPRVTYLTHSDVYVEQAIGKDSRRQLNNDVERVHISPVNYECQQKFTIVAKFLASDMKLFIFQWHFRQIVELRVL